MNRVGALAEIQCRQEVYDMNDAGPSNSTSYCDTGTGHRPNVPTVLVFGLQGGDGGSGGIGLPGRDHFNLCWKCAEQVNSDSARPVHRPPEQTLPTWTPNPAYACLWLTCPSSRHPLADMSDDRVAASSLACQYTSPPAGVGDVVPELANAGVVLWVALSTNNAAAGRVQGVTGCAVA